MTMIHRIIPLAVLALAACTAPAPNASPADGPDTRPDAATWDARVATCDIDDVYTAHVEAYCELACGDEGIGRFEDPRECRLRCPADANSVFRRPLETGLRFEECGVCE